MRLILPLIFAVGLALPGPLARAQGTIAPAASATPTERKAKAAAATASPTAAPAATTKPSKPAKAERTPKPEPTPKPERRKREPQTDAGERKRGNIFSWLFGSRKRDEVASPTPSPTPTPAKRVARPKPTATPETGEESAPAKPEVTPRPGPAADEPPGDSTAKPPPALKTEQAPAFVPPADLPPKLPPRPTMSLEEEDRRFEAARMKAQDDADVVAAREASEKAATGDTYYKARKKYYQLLFGKMREMEPDLAERIKQTETASLERLDRRKETMGRILETGAGVPVPGQP